MKRATLWLKSIAIAPMAGANAQFWDETADGGRRPCQGSARYRARLFQGIRTSALQRITGSISTGGGSRYVRHPDYRSQPVLCPHWEPPTRGRLFDVDSPSATANGRPLWFNSDSPVSAG